MRNIICLLGVLLFTGIDIQAQNFEGVIHYEVEDMKAAGMGEMVYMIKDNKARMEYGQGAQQGAVLFFPEKKQMAIIISQMKGYMLMDTDDLDETTNEERATATGETKTIAGHTCEVWTISSAEEDYEACIARGMGNFIMPNPQQNTPKWAQALMEEGFMPLEVVTINEGEQKVEMKATNIEEKQLDTSLFSIPEGYKDMTSMMNQMYNQQRN